MTTLRTTVRTKVKRHPERARVDRATAFGILDQARICHVGVRANGHLRVLPTAFARVGDQLYLHGAIAAAMLSDDAIRELCVTVTLVDGLVLAKSAFSHSMNYRSLMLIGNGRLVVEGAEKHRSLMALTEKTLPGRSKEARAPSDDELQTTRVIALSIDEGSIKIRTGPPKDKPRDEALDTWSGVIPLGRPLKDPVLENDAPRPPSVRKVTTAYSKLTTKEGWLLSADPGMVQFDTVFAYLSKEAYWCRGISRQTLQRAMKHSVVAGAYAGGKQLAFARVVTDRSTFAYLCDVFVVPEMQGVGVGSRLVRFVQALPELAGLRRWLLGTRDGHEFYRRLGWESTDGNGRWMYAVSAKQE